MDNIRDLRSVTDLTRFVEKQEVKTDPFGQNSSAEQAYRRAERIAEALHLITNHVVSTEPVRLRVRELATELLEVTLRLQNGFRASGGILVRDVSTKIREIISNTRMLAVSGAISFQNAHVMTEALDDLGHFVLAAQRTQLSEAVLLSKDVLTPKPRLLSPITDIKDTFEVQSRTTMISIKDKKSLITKKTMISAKGEEYRIRHGSVMDILRGRDPLNIRDIAAHFPQFSEKTIQRTLAQLVDSGSVKSIGMKRWRRYFLPDGLKKL